jgi:hypothetical protein
MIALAEMPWTTFEVSTTTPTSAQSSVATSSSHPANDASSSANAG